MTVRTVLLGAVALAAGGLLAVGVAAHTSHTPSSLTINAGAGYFYGNVTSPKEKCRPHRRVRVFRKRPGNDKLYGAEKSLGGMNLGSYTVEESTAPDVGTYYAEIKKRDLRAGSDRHDHICGRATSNTVVVEP
jgi:hypothetical protein